MRTQADIFRFKNGLQDICDRFSFKPKNIRHKDFLLKSGHIGENAHEKKSLILQNLTDK